MPNLGLVGLTQRRARRLDPLKYFKFSSEGQRQIAVQCSKAEIYAHAAVRSGKTTGGAVVVLALLRGLRELDGVKLPRIRIPGTAALIVPSYKQSTGSSVQTYRELLGDHPHHVAYVHKGLQYVGVIYIKPDNWSNPDPTTWSRLMVFPHDGELPEGLTLDVAHGDEPPPERMWRAIRFRKRAGWPLIKMITGTPMERFKTNGSGWEWLMREEPDTEFLSCLDHPAAGKVRITWSLRDNAALSEEDIRELYESAIGDPHMRSKLDGEHVDASGRPPWNVERIDQWLKLCAKPETLEIDVEGYGTIKLEILEHPRLGHVYYGPADLSSGTVAEDAPTLGQEKRDPSGFHIVDRHHRRLCARVNGYIEPYVLGRLHAKVARYYNDCLIDPENNGGWIKSYLDGVRDEGYDNIARERFKDTKTGRWATRLGFNTNETSKAAFVGAIQRGITNDDLTIAHREVLLNIRACTLDKLEKVQWAKHRGEDVILTGRWAYETRPAVEKKTTAEKASPRHHEFLKSQKVGERRIVGGRRAR